MKITKYFSLIALMVISLSCSKDDEPAPAVEKATLSLGANTQILEVPAAMASSDDVYAEMATGWVMLANSMSANLSLFQAPSGAAKSTELIVPVNGRSAAGGSAVVYTWSDPNYGSIAYQIRDASTKFTFELFFKGTTDTGWYRYIYAEEAKDKSAGYMLLLDAWGLMSSDRNEVMMRWDWTRSGDNFTFKMSDFDSGFNFLVTVNQKTKVGSVVYFEGTEKIYEINWDAQGKGTWKVYESSQVVDEGSWG
jgi:hypothetical protein